MRYLIVTIDIIIINYTHTQVQSLQYDFLRRNSFPFPATVDGERESHGTNVAGEVAMEKGNNICGVGVAYNSFITGLVLYRKGGGDPLNISTEYIMLQA